jgi:ABC-2 type transport system ATP-binding protein
MPLIRKIGPTKTQSAARPKATDPRILNATYLDGTAMVTASADIRDSISEELYHKDFRILELRVEERSLEEIFVETLYGGA